MSAPVQLDLLSMLDYDARAATQRAVMLRYLDGKPETYSDRYDFWCLTPGEACPGCGHTFPAGGHDASGDHYMPTGATECTGRRAYREHAQIAYRGYLNGYFSLAAFYHAVAASAPCWTAAERDAWLADPATELLGEVTA